jgi:uncharacterized Zn-finger protein
MSTPTALTQNLPHDNDSVGLGAQDLPAYCPNKKMTLWNSHPRVYLDVNQAGGASCPYCGTHYHFEGPAPTGH